MFVPSEHIQATLKNLPHKPGCYLMRDDKSTVIYVGKAVDLHSRVRSYFDNSVTDPKTLRLREQSTMGMLRKMPFRRGHDHPTERQGTAMVDHTHHQRQAAASHHAAIHDQVDGRVRERVQQFLGNWQKPTVDGMGITLKKAPKAFDKTFLRRAIAGGVVGDRGQVGMLAAGQTADQGHQSIEMFFAMPSRTRLIELHDRLFYGTIAAIRVAQNGSS